MKTPSASGTSLMTRHAVVMISTSATDGAASMNGTLDLSKLTFTLKQRAIA